MSALQKVNALALFALLVSQGMAVGAEPVATLTAEEIKQAIEWGRSGDASPYLLHHLARPGRINHIIVGAVYTPFVRLALAARAARQSGRDFSANDVSQDLLAPVVYVAFRWYCGDEAMPCYPQRDDPVAGDVAGEVKVALPDYVVPVPGVRVRIAPLWVTRDLNVLSAFGGPPSRDTILVAAYPITVLRAEHDFVLYRNMKVPGWQVSREERIGRLRTEEVARWR